MNSLDTAQVISIIEACARHGVATIKFSGLEITLHPKVEVGPVGELSPTKPEPISTLPEPTLGAKMPDLKNPRNARLPTGWDDLELEQKEEFIAELQLTDPQAAEELIESGELIDADNEHGDDE